MTMRRQAIREQMQAQRPLRKRQLCEVSPSPSSKWRRFLASDDSPSSSPNKGPLAENSDEEAPSFRPRSFYRSQKKLVLTPSPPADHKKSSDDNSLSDGEKKARVPTPRKALSPIKNIQVNVRKHRKKSKSSSRQAVPKKRRQSVPVRGRYVGEIKSSKASPGGEEGGECTTPSNKFFKHKSPASASKALGGIIVGKGFDLKFVVGSLNKSYAKSPGQKKGTPPKRRNSVPRRKLKTDKEKERVEADRKLKAEKESAQMDADENDATSGIAGSEELTSPQSRTSVEVTQPGVSDKHHASSDNDSLPARSYSLFSSDAQSDTDVADSIQSQPSSVNNSQSQPTALAQEEEKDGGKYFSIFSRKRRSSRLAVTYSKCNGKKADPKHSPTNKKKFASSKSDESQMMLDAGQEQFGATQCMVCGMVYTPADAADQTTHTKFHQSALAALKFPGWKKERVVKDFLEDGSRVIAVLPEDQRFMVKKVEEVNRVMGQELGFSDQIFSFHGSYKAFLYISDEKRIEGCCIAESIQKGYRLLPNTIKEASTSGQRPWLCSTVAERATVGIGRLWVYGPSRKQGIASRIVDCVRQWFEYGVLIDKSKVAFSDPTPDGRHFAAKYTGTQHFLVYKYNSA